MTGTQIDNPDIVVSADTSANEPLPTAQKAVKKKGIDGFYWGTGRRKTSVARVRIKIGEGKILINKRELAHYFTLVKEQRIVLSPLVTVGKENGFDVFVNVRGGGISGQAGATSLGIARALKGYDDTYTQALRDGGLLTRDGRMVERKKPGQSGARKRYQFSKR